MPLMLYNWFWSLTDVGDRINCLLLLLKFHQWICVRYQRSSSSTSSASSSSEQEGAGDSNSLCSGEIDDGSNYRRALVILKRVPSRAVKSPDPTAELMLGFQLEPQDRSVRCVCCFFFSRGKCLKNLSFLWVLYFGASSTEFSIAVGCHIWWHADSTEGTVCVRSSRGDRVSRLFCPSFKRIKRERKQVSSTSFASLLQLMCLSKKQKEKKTGFVFLTNQIFSLLLPSYSILPSYDILFQLGKILALCLFVFFLSFFPASKWELKLGRW